MAADGSATGTKPRINWLNDKEARAWRAYIIAKQMLDTQLERDLLAEAKLSQADYAVLVNLSEVPDHRLRATELAERMSWSRSRLSHQVGRMEKRELVRREDCGSDARGSFVTLTDHGFETIESAAPAHLNSVRSHLLDHLTDQQIDVLGDIFVAVLSNLEAKGKLPTGCNTSAMTTPPVQ